MRNFTVVKRLSVLTLLVFVFSMCTFTAGINQSLAATQNSPFKDVANNHWALQHIAKMNFRGVVTGYDDGSFQPDKGVTQVEAVLMAVRNMNVQEELLTIDTAQAIPFIVPDWAKQNFKRELLFALQAGLIVPTENNFDASSKASRAWMTQLMVRMIDKDTEASLLAYQTPAFTDFAQIPRWALGYVNTAVKYDLVSGFPEDNSFRPLQVVTRAQSVSLLSRSEKYLEPGENVIQGKILSLSGARLSISSQGTVKSFDITANTLVYDNNNSLSEWINLNANDTVQIIYDGSKVQYIEVIKEDASVASISGTVLYIIPAEKVIVVKDQAEIIHTKTLDSEAVCVNQYDKSYEFSQIQPGYEVELGLNADGNIISMIIAGTDDTFGDSGIINTIEPEQKLIIIKTDLHGFKSYQYDEDLEIEILGQRFSTVEDLQVGDEVRIKANGSLLTEIELLQAQQELMLSGKIVLTSPEKGILVIEQNKEILTFSLANRVKLTIPGIVSPSLTDLLLDDNVDLVVEGGEVTSISVKNRNDYYNSQKGTIFAVDITNLILTIKLDNGDLKTYEINRAAELLIDDDYDAQLSDLEKDMKVEFELLDDKIIYLETRNSIEGYVASINPDRHLISIRTAGNDLQTFILSNSVDVDIEGISKPDLDDISNNDYVELKVDDDIVNDIRVQNTLVYEITRVYESEKLRVEDEDGDRDYLYLTSRVDISIPGISSPEMDDFSEGDMVRATFLGNELTAVELIPVVYGEITTINSYSEKITIRDFEGKSYTYEFDKDSEVIDDEQTYYSLNALASGDRVKVKENIEGETRFYIMQKETATFVNVNDDVDKVYVNKNGSYVYYKLAPSVYMHSGTQALSFRHLDKNDIIDLYIVDDRVFEIEKK